MLDDEEDGEGEGVESGWSEALAGAAIIPNQLSRHLASAGTAVKRSAVKRSAMPSSVAGRPLSPPPGGEGCSEGGGRSESEEDKQRQGRGERQRKDSVDCVALPRRSKKEKGDGSGSGRKVKSRPPKEAVLLIAAMRRDDLRLGHDDALPAHHGAGDKAAAAGDTRPSSLPRRLSSILASHDGRGWHADELFATGAPAASPHGASTPAAFSVALETCVVSAPVSVRTSDVRGRDNGREGSGSGEVMSGEAPGERRESVEGGGGSGGMNETPRGSEGMELEDCDHESLEDLAQSPPR